MWINSEVMGVKITLKEETLRDVLRLGVDQENTILDKADVQRTLIEMGYHSNNVSRQVNKFGFIPPFQYLVTQLSVCFSKKIGHFNELSHRMMEVVHAVVQEKPYNYSKFLMRDLEANIHDRQPFLIYPRFVTKVITSQLDFGGVRSWYPRAELALQENIRDATLVPSTNHTGRITSLWLYVKCMYNVLDEEDE
ncbi:hypothetical protein HanRHA438_Chr12g0568091 [Helianthus annuus]|uniref:Uncharacterized protein n=1 Tax=Helianthus annuus TaxID=4232 RepID=A0A9K3MXC9_HELAN|nr:hypothetical protein HanXRQr2_Chr12g0556691 [Helianthus annuus]KAJ0494748.1 hypothetical protein HanIR_Chr12g0600981 [Helianthus annuus]KAJ0679340.1 hypothetical protein HanOQP8_Chr12g0458281 [Helianthus annuus]KAJ0863947.1 hypothetical protein HanPSC8_Chr12g0535951 [Helianthus annuus]KAJ0867869.1 hypothetical protein HanRHA438_Chr12g0568091 [Helianthus annuus]